MTNKEFWVECKYRNITKLLDDEEQAYDDLKKSGKSEVELEKELEWKLRIDLGSKKQFTRFKKLTKENHLFYLLGLQDDRDVNLEVHLIPMNYLNIDTIALEEVDEFVISNPKPITPDRLWSRIFRITVPKSYCIKCRKQIAFHGINPFCCDFWEKWHERTNFKESGKFCQICGKEKDGISVARPLYKSCYAHTDKLIRDTGIDKMLYW